MSRIKYEIVWDTIKLKLPELKIKIQRIIDDLEREKRK